MRVILQHEIMRLFTTPYVWLLFAATQFILAWSFLARLETWLSRQHEDLIQNSLFGVTDFVVVPLFALGQLLLAVLLPFLTAQSIAGEKQNKTWALWASSPVSLANIILSKFLSLFIFCCFTVLTIILMAIALSWQANLDYGQLMISVIIFLFSCAAFIMLGLFISACFTHVIPAIFVAVFVFVFLLNTNWLLLGTENSLLNYLSFKQHAINGYKGLLSSYDIVFFIIMISFFYIMVFIKLDKQRLS